MSLTDKAKEFKKSEKEKEEKRLREIAEIENQKKIHKENIFLRFMDTLKNVVGEDKDFEITKHDGKLICDLSYKKESMYKLMYDTILVKPDSRHFDQSPRREDVIRVYDYKRHKEYFIDIDIKEEELEKIIVEELAGRL